MIPKRALGGLAACSPRLAAFDCGLLLDIRCVGAGTGAAGSSGSGSAGPAGSEESDAASLEK